MKYLQNCRTLDELKQARRRWAKSLHPDIHGSEDEMKRLNAEYEEMLVRLSQSLPIDEGTSVADFFSHLQALARDAFQMAGLPYVYCPVSTEPRSDGDPAILLTLKVSAADLSPQQTTCLLDALFMVVGKYTTGWLPMIKYYHTGRKAPYYLYRTGWVNECGKRCDITYIGWEPNKYIEHEVVRGYSLTNDIDKAFVRIYNTYNISNPYLAWKQDKATGRYYCMHESKTLKLKDFV